MVTQKLLHQFESTIPLYPLHAFTFHVESFACSGSLTSANRWHQLLDRLYHCEYISGNFQSYLFSNGVSHRKSCRHTLSQNVLFNERSVTSSKQCARSYYVRTCHPNYVRLPMDWLKIYVNLHKSLCYIWWKHFPVCSCKFCQFVASRRSPGETDHDDSYTDSDNRITVDATYFPDHPNSFSSTFIVAVINSIVVA